MKNLRKEKIIKKIIIIILLCILLMSKVQALEYKEITNDAEIRHKWYKEIIEGDYYPLKEDLPGYIVDYNNIKYIDYSLWENEYCYYPDEYYIKEKQLMREYKRISEIRYVLLENFNYTNNVKIYNNNKPIEYEMLSYSNNILKIDLGKKYLCDNLLFYIENATNYKLSLHIESSYKSAQLSKEIKEDNIIIPDKSWITSTATYKTKYTLDNPLDITDFTTLIKSYDICRYKEKYVYKYKIKKYYYDENYYNYIEGYTKDINDYKVYYKGKPIINTVEIIKEKVVTKPVVEYIYLEPEKEILEIDSSTKKECHPKIETQIIEKEVFKTPKKIYIVITLLIIIILLISIKCFKKYVD